MTIVGENIVATIRQRYDFTVDKLPLRGPDNLNTPWYGLFRSDIGQPVGGGSVSERYMPHTTDDIVALVEAAAPTLPSIAQSAAADTVNVGVDRIVTTKGISTLH